MNILKPQKMLFDNLRTIENLQSELIENDELENEIRVINANILLKEPEKQLINYLIMLRLRG